MSTSNFLAKMDGLGLPKMKKDELLRPEIAIVAGMKWSLLVRQSWRGVWGAMAVLLEGIDEKDPRRLKSVQAAARAEEWLKKEAPFCDAMFLYTESQLMWAALLANDPDLVRPWLEKRLPREVWDKIVECCEVFVERRREFSQEVDGGEVELCIRYGKDVEKGAAKEGDKEVHLAVKAIEVKEKEMREREREERERREVEKREKKKKREEERRRADDVFGGDL